MGEMDSSRTSSLTIFGSQLAELDRVPSLCPSKESVSSDMRALELVVESIVVSQYPTDKNTAGSTYIAG